MFDRGGRDRRRCSCTAHPHPSYPRSAIPDPSSVPFTALRFDTDDADAWSDALLAAGALSVEATDPFAGTPQRAGAIRRARRAGRAALAGVASGRAVRRGRRRRRCAWRGGRCARRSRCRCTRRYAVEDQDWVRATQAQFGPIAIGDRLHIVPTWCEPPQQGVVDSPRSRARVRHRLASDDAPVPRMVARATARRASRCSTTDADRACSRSPRRSSARRRSFGTDVDPQALRASRDNARANARRRRVRRRRTRCRRGTSTSSSRTSSRTR